MLGVFPLFDHLLFQCSNRALESLILMNQTLRDMVGLDVLVRSMVQGLGQGLGQDLVQEVGGSTLGVEVGVLIVLMYRGQIGLAREVLVVQRVRLLFLEVSGVSEGWLVVCLE